MSGEQLLKRPIDRLSLQDAKVEIVAAALAEKADLPISFIQADPEVKISLDTSGTNVRGVLDLLVGKAPSYRYGVLEGRLVVYPNESKWQARVDDLKLGPVSRLQMAWTLSRELKKRFPSFSNLCGPWVLGDPRDYTFQDLVSVTGPGSVLEILLQLLGNRPSTFLLIVKEDGWTGPSLSTSSTDQIVNLKVTAPTLTPGKQGEKVQLQVVGTLRGGLAKDLTAKACNTTYSVSDQRVLGVSPGGLVTVRGPGDAEVKVTSERSSETLTFHVVLSEGASSDPTLPIYLTAEDSKVAAATDLASSIACTSSFVTSRVLPTNEGSLAELCARLATAALGSEPELAAEAARELGSINHPIAVPYLKKVLEANVPASFFVVSGLARMATPETVTILVDAYDKASGFTPLRIRLCLSGTGVKIEDPVTRRKLESILAPKPQVPE